MIVVIDTNLIISAFLKPFSDTASILRLILDGKILLAYDLRILLEYEEVLKRQEFDFDIVKIKDFINYVKFRGIAVNPGPISRSLPDIDDEIFLEAAIASKSDYLVTGNLKHFPEDLCENIKVVSVVNFLQLFNKAAQ